MRPSDLGAVMRDPSGGLDLRFGVLGPLRAWRDGEPVGLGAVQQRVVLAVLLLHANRPLGRSQLIEAVWGPAAPAYAVNLLQKHVSGLRRALEPDRPGREPSRLLAWTDAGYQITVADGRLDLAEFQRQTDRGRVARRSGDPAAAAGALRAALDLWRGPLCDGLTSPLLDAERDRLAERRLAVAEEAIEVDLALGRHADVVAELTRLVADHPLREPLCGLLMLALYRSGRQGEALAAYRDARRRLDDELGVEPSAPLQRLHQQILAGDPAVAAPPAPVAAPGPAREQPAGDQPARQQPAGERPARERPADERPAPEQLAREQPAGAAGDTRAGPPAGAAAAVAGEPEWVGPPRPAQLPRRLSHFVGRAAEIERLGALARQDAADAAVGIAVIAGTAGVGKTTLAVHWAHQIADHFPDGQLYVNLRGFDPAGPPMEPAEAIRVFLDAFGVLPQQLPVSLAGQAALYRSLLAGRRVLIVLDNAADADQVRPLLPGSAGCLVVVTSRNRLSGLVAAEGAHPLTVGLLTPAEGSELLAARLGADRVAAEPDAVGDIVAACAGLPLALTIVAARAATQPAFPLAGFAAQLNECRGQLDAGAGLLDAFDAEDRMTDVRAVFSWSYQRLSPTAARLFRLLGVHPGADVAPAAAASLAGAPLAQLRPDLAELARAHLLTERTPGLFAMHDLLRAYAAEQVEAVDSAEDRDAALHRVLDHYLHTAHRADGLLHPHRDPIVLAPPRPGVTVTALSGAGPALDWFGAQHATLLAALDLASAAGQHGHACQLAWALDTFLERRGHWYDQVASQRACLAAAQRTGDRPLQADAQRRLGRALTWLGRYEEAATHYAEALAQFERLGDAGGQARVLHNTAWQLYRQGRHDEALARARRSLELFRAAGHHSGHADALNAVGWFHAQLGLLREALAYCEQALALQREIGDRWGEGATLDSLAYIHHHLGHWDESVTGYGRAIEVWRQLGDRFYEADTLVRLGDAHRAAGNPDAARQAWSAGLTILEETARPEAAGVREKLSELEPNSVVPGQA